MSFLEIPIIDLNVSKSDKPRFLRELRYALIEVGFFLLINYELDGPNGADFNAIEQQTVDFFKLPDNVKKDIEMIHSKHFLGYSRLANELTAKHTDWREQYDLGTELPEPNPNEPIYKNIEGPNLWPDESHIPHFRETILQYHDKMFHLSKIVRHLVCESIGLKPEALDRYFKPNQQCKMKLIAYPDSSQLGNQKSNLNDDTPTTEQGVGPHRDSDFLTYIFQVTPHTDSLQVQNFQGNWVTVPYVKNSLVVNVGQTLEAITKGVCKATIHRVLVPKAGSGTRLSIPFFLTIDLDSRRAAVDDIPEEVIKVKDDRDKKIKDWAVDVGFQFIPDIEKHPVGYAVFRNRIKSHQDVAAKWYPTILKDVLAEYS